MTLTFTKPNAFALLLLVTTIGLAAPRAAAVAAPTGETNAAAATPIEPTTTLRGKQIGFSSTDLRGGAPVSEARIPIPGDYRAIAGELTVTLDTAPVLVERSSAITVLIDGQPHGSVALAPSRTQTLRVPFTKATAPGGLLTITLLGQLRTDRARCPDPTAPGAYVRIDKTRLTLTGQRDPEPSLQQLPEILLEKTAGRHEAVLIRSRLDDPSSLRASAIALGALSRATGRTAPAKIIDETEAPVLGRHLIDIRVQEKREVRIARRGDRLHLVVAAPADELFTLTAAVMNGNLDGADVRPGLAEPVRSAPLPSRAIPIPPVSIAGSGTQTLNLPFRIPEGRVLSGGSATVTLSLTSDTPGGGRIVGVLNDAIRTQVDLPTGVSARQTGFTLINRPPVSKSGWLRAGENAIALRVQMASGGIGCGESVTPTIQLYKDSALRFESRRREVTQTLAAWPYPLVDPDRTDGRDTEITLPRNPSYELSAAVIKTIAETQRWIDRPWTPTITIAGETSPASPAPPARHTLVVVDDPDQIPGASAAGNTRNGHLYIRVTADGRATITAVGARALRPVSQDFRSGRLTGSRVLTLANGEVIRVDEARPSAWEPRLSPWVGPAAILSAILLVGVFFRLFQIRRRLRRLPAPPVSTTPHLGHRQDLIDAWKDDDRR